MDPETTMNDLQVGYTKFLERMLEMNQALSAGQHPPDSSFHSNAVPNIAISAYMDRLVRYSRCSCEALVGSLLFLQHFSTFSRHAITVYNVHRVLITSVVVAAKSRDDAYFTNVYYGRIGGISGSEMRSLEIEFLRELDWDAWLDKDAFDETLALIRNFATDLSMPSEEAVQAINYWQDRQSRFVVERRQRVRGILAADVAAEALRWQNAPGSPLRGLSQVQSTPASFDNFTGGIGGGSGSGFTSVADVITAEDMGYGVGSGARLTKQAVSADADDAEAVGEGEDPASPDAMAGSGGGTEGFSWGDRVNSDLSIQASPFYPRSQQPSSTQPPLAQTQPVAASLLGRKTQSSSAGTAASSRGGGTNRGHHSSHNSRPAWDTPTRGSGGGFMGNTNASGRRPGSPAVLPSGAPSFQSNTGFFGGTGRPQALQSNYFASPSSESNTPISLGGSQPHLHSQQQRALTKNRFSTSSFTATPESNRYNIVGTTNQVHYSYAFHTEGGPTTAGGTGGAYRGGAAIPAPGIQLSRNDAGPAAGLRRNSEDDNLGGSGGNKVTPSFPQHQHYDPNAAPVAGGQQQGRSQRQRLTGRKREMPAQFKEER